LHSSAPAHHAGILVPRNGWSLRGVGISAAERRNQERITHHEGKLTELGHHEFPSAYPRVSSLISALCRLASVISNDLSSAIDEKNLSVR
jgi:hypothetical protein